MFERQLDQAAGLRRLFPTSELVLLPLGCTAADACDRIGAVQLVRALQRTGRRPVLIDLLGGRAGQGDFEGVDRIDANRWLPASAGRRELVGFCDALRWRAARNGPSFDTAVIAADPLRLADLTAELTGRIVLVARDETRSIAHLYAQIKALHLAHGLRDYFTTFLDPISRATAVATHRRLADTAARFLGAAVEFGGVVAATRGPDAACWNRLAADALRWSRSVADPDAALH